MRLSIHMIQLREKARALVHRFPVSIFWQAVGFLIGIAIIWLRPDDAVLADVTQKNILYDHLTRLVPAIIGAWLMSTVSRLCVNLTDTKRGALIDAAASFILFIMIASSWYGIETPSRQLLLGTQGVYLALFFLLLFLLERTGRKPGLPPFIFSVGFALVTSLLFFFGLGLCLAAFWSLIVTNVEPWFIETSYLLIALIAYEVWGLGTFLSALPSRENAHEFSAAAQKILLYLLFPVYALLLLVLYLYVGKIVLAGEMPVGAMNWYASSALLGFSFFFAMLAAQERLPLFSRFLRWGLVLFLPILAVQLYGVYLRHMAYGLTTARYASMICTFCGIYTLVVAFLRSKPQQVYLCAAILSLVFSLTPLNIIDVPRHNQETRLSKILTEHDLLENGTLRNRDNLSPELVEEIKNIAYYIGADASPLAASIINTNFNLQREIFYFYGEDIDELSVAGYHTLLYFHADNISAAGALILHRTDGSEEHIDLQPYGDILLRYRKENKTTFPMEYETEHYRVHFANASIHKGENNAVTWINANGFVLIR